MHLIERQQIAYTSKEQEKNELGPSTTFKATETYTVKNKATLDDLFKLTIRIPYTIWNRSLVSM